MFIVGKEIKTFRGAKLDKTQGGCRGSQDWCHFPGSIFEKVYFLAFLRKAIKKDLLLDFNGIKQKGSLLEFLR